MAQTYVTTTVRLTAEQYEFLRRTHKNLSKLLRDKLDEEFFSGGKPNTIQELAMDKIYEIGDYASCTATQTSVDQFHKTLINMGVYVPYSYCVHFLKSKENP